MFNALNSPLRLQLISLLSSGEHTVSELSAKASKSQPLVSQHLKVLKAAGVVEFNKRGRSSYYHLADTGIMELIQDANRLALKTAPLEAGVPVS
ncbi:ArsR/SmtB family transcription factor [Corynebacterium occultum]|uniref:ArsR/SmtB family transcription factor n=1 Tax=Corynebacterium occultum TaxID=2675219 RepID=UPI0022B1E7A5|nr:metalloregulator ArsR/SmtB family transcription factor [Corynebacterium occultum]